MKTIKIATYNVNSIRARQKRVLNLLQSQDIDVLAVQETKTSDENFPTDIFENAGFHLCYCGYKNFNGVAIISKFPLRDKKTEFDAIPEFNDTKEPRFCEARVDIDDKTLTIASCYIPNGRAVNDDHYFYKLKWMNSFKDYLSGRHADSPKNDSLYMALGDFNVIPRDQDVWETFKKGDDILYTSKKERDAFFDIEKSGFREITYKFLPAGGNYTFYDYRMLRFQKNEGMRLDFAFASPELSKLVKKVEILRDERRKRADVEEPPSDHVPVVCTVEI